MHGRLCPNILVNLLPLENDTTVPLVRMGWLGWRGGGVAGWGKKLCWEVWALDGGKLPWAPLLDLSLEI